MKDQAQSSSDDEKRLRVVHAGAEQYDAYRNSTRLICDEQIFWRNTLMLFLQKSNVVVSLSGIADLYCSSTCK